MSNDPNYDAGFRGAFEPYSFAGEHGLGYNNPFPRGSSEHRAWRRGKADASKQVNRDMADDPSVVYAPGSYAEHIQQAIRSQADREAEENRLERWHAFGAAETVQELKAWILAHHPELVE